MREGWQIKTLGDVCVTVQDGAHESPKLQFDSPGNGRFLYITSKNIRNNHLDLENVSYVDEEFHNRIYPRCKPCVGDVLLTKDGANTGNVTLNTLDQPFSLLSSVCLIKTAPDSLLPSFLSYFIQSPDGLKSITGQMTGAAIKRIILRDIKLAEIPIPPLPEQQRIVALLDEAFAGLATAKANAERNLLNARTIFESHLQSVFSQRGEGWPTKQLGEVCDFQGGSQPPKSEFVYEPKPGYVRFLQIRDYASERHLTYISESNKNRLCNADDIMIGRYGASVGKILTGRAGAYNVALIKTIPDLQLLDRDFFFNYLASGAFQGCLADVASRSAQNGFSKDDIYGFPIPVPPLSEQRMVIEQLNPLDAETQRLTRLYERKLAALEELKKSLLHQAFNGEL